MSFALLNFPFFFFCFFFFKFPASHFDLTTHEKWIEFQWKWRRCLFLTWRTRFPCRRWRGEWPVLDIATSARTTPSTKRTRKKTTTEAMICCYWLKNTWWWLAVDFTDILVLFVTIKNGSSGELEYQSEGRDNFIKIIIALLNNNNNNKKRGRIEPIVCQLVPVFMIFFGLHNNQRHVWSINWNPHKIQNCWAHTRVKLFFGCTGTEINTKFQIALRNCFVFSVKMK